MQHISEVIEGLVNNVDVIKEEYIPDETEKDRGYTFHGPDGWETIKHAIILKAPTYDNSKHEILYINVSREEKERLFEMLDAELHDETYKQLDDENCRLRSQLDEVQELIEYYGEQERLRGRRGIA
jgi:hypothetical protein